MPVAISVLTPDWLLQVSDAPGGRPRALRLQRDGAPGLLTWVGPAAVLDAIVPVLQERGAADPADLTQQIATEAGARLPADVLATALLAGWGTSPEGHAASWRWRATNFESDEEEGGFSVDGTWLMPSFAQPGGVGKAKARTSLSVQVSATEELPADVRRGIEKLPRDLRKGASPTDLALRLAGWIAEVEGGAPALLALLRPDGSLEGGVIADGALSPVDAGAGDGVFPVVVSG